MRKILLLIFVATIFAACGSSTTGKKATSKEDKFLPGSTGSPYEIVVVCSNDLWEASIGDTLKNALQEYEGMLNQLEPKFDIIRKREVGFKGIFMKHRNIVVLEVTNTIPDGKSALYTVQYNKWADPQIIITLKAKSEKLLYDLFISKENDILELLELAEQSRFVARLKAFASSEIDTMLINNFDVSISLPKSYKIRNVIKPDFAWISYEMPISSQGIIVYTYPYDGKELTEKSLLKKRNQFIKRVPGQLPNTYMQSSDAFDPTVENVDIDGREWVKMSGFWNVHNDFMGGPYRNYTTIDTARNRVVSIDCYVYSPDGGKGQRNYIKQLNAVVRTVKIL